MVEVTTEDALLVTLREHPATESTTGCTLQTVVEKLVGDGTRLSQQVEVAVAVEALLGRGLVERNTDSDGTERLSLTREGAARGTTLREDLSSAEITVVEDGASRQTTVGTLASKTGRTLVDVARNCTPDDTYYRDEEIVDEGIVGREDEQEGWSRIVDRCRNEQRGALVLVSGPGGIGKTTLAETFLEESDVTVVHRARCQRESTEPYGPIREILETAVETTPFATAGPSGAPEAATDIADADAYGAQRAALFHDITDVLAPDEGLAVLFLDDIGRGDAATLRYLSYLLEEIRERPLLVLGTYRPGTLSESSISPEGLSESIDHKTFELDTFDRDETRELIERVVGRRGVPEVFVTAVYDRTDGIPMFVESTVEALLESEQVDSQFEWYPQSADEIVLPDEVHETVLRRIDVLDDRSREVLRWVSLSSEALPLTVLADLVESTVQEVRRSVDVLVEADILEEDGTGDSFTLRSNVIRESLTQLASASGERDHRALASALAADSETSAGDGDESGEDGGDVTTQEDIRGESSIEHAATIAYHYEQAGDYQEAIEWYERAATRAKELYAHESAVGYYHSILDIARKTDEGAVLSAGEELASVYYLLGEYQQAQQYVQFVRGQLGDDVADRQRLADFAAGLLTARNEFDAAIEELENALELDESPTAQRCKLLLSRAGHELAVSDIETARETIRAALDIARELDDEELMARTRSIEANLAEATSEYEEAREKYEYVLDVYESTDSHHNAAYIRNQLGRVLRKQGDFEGATRYHETARSTFDEIGDRYGVGITENALGLVAWRQSEYDRAREHYERAIAVSTQLRDEYGVALCRLNLGNVLREQGDYDGASECYDAALPVFEETDSHPLVAIAYHDMGKLANRRGLYQTAREQCERALEMYQQVDHDHHAGAVQNVLGLVHTRTGEYDRAQGYFEDALELARKVDNHALVGKIHANWALLAVETDAFDEVLDHCQTALEALEDARNKWFIGRVHLARARAGLAQGRLEEVETQLAQAKAAYESAGVRHGVAKTRLLGGHLSRERQNVEDARDGYERALETFRDIGAYGDHLEALGALCELEREAGNERRVSELCGDAIDVLELVDSATLHEMRRDFEDCLADA